MRHTPSRLFILSTEITVTSSTYKEIVCDLDMSSHATLGQHPSIISTAVSKSIVSGKRDQRRNSSQELSCIKQVNKET